MSFFGLTFLIAFIGLVVAQSDGVFYNPPTPGPTGEFLQNPIYVIGQTVQIRWAVSYDKISLVLWQNNNNDFEYLLPAVTNPNNYNWIVSTNKNISLENVFFLQVFNAGTNDKFGCHYFNITGTSTTTSTISSSTSSIPSISSTPQTFTTSASAVSTSSAGQSAPTATPSASSSSSTKVGLGVGLGLGIPFLVATAAAAWLINRSHRRRDINTKPNLAAETPWEEGEQSGPPGRPIHELPEANSGVIELSGTTLNHELPGR